MWVGIRSLSPFFPLSPLFSLSAVFWAILLSITDKKNEEFLLLRPEVVMFSYIFCDRACPPEKLIYFPLGLSLIHI